VAARRTACNDDEAVGHGAFYVGGDSTKITQTSPITPVATVTKVNGTSATGGRMAEVGRRKAAYLISQKSWFAASS
jgi:hypothetical protein